MVLWLARGAICATVRPSAWIPPKIFKCWHSCQIWSRCSKPKVLSFSRICCGTATTSAIAERVFPAFYRRIRRIRCNSCRSSSRLGSQRLVCGRKHMWQITFPPFDRSWSHSCLDGVRQRCHGWRKETASGSAERQVARWHKRRFEERCLRLSSTSPFISSACRENRTSQEAD